MDENILLPENIFRNLNTRFVGQKIIYYPALGSTMEAAKREALWGAEAGTVIVAEKQTAGRGRFDRTWLSPKGGLALSIILRPNLDYLPYMIMLASLAVHYSIREITGLKSQIKWPNDVLINEKKVCGILIENDIRNNSLIYTIIGIGLNVNMKIVDYPEISSLATSLSDQVGKKVSKLDMLRQILVETERLYQTLPQKELILEQWKDHLVTLGQEIRVNMGSKVYRGTAESVAEDGSLLLRRSNGSLMKIIAGEVTLR
jgi:BirA family biotin operon repressor/biotin-[acetyl-CoA-carboxylase] ligase